MALNPEVNSSIFILGEAHLEFFSPFSEPFLMQHCDWHNCLKVMRLTKTMINHHTYPIYILLQPTLLCTVSHVSCVYIREIVGALGYSVIDLAHMNKFLEDFAIKWQPIRFLKLSMSNLLNVWSLFIMLNPSVFYTVELFLNLSAELHSDIHCFFFSHPPLCIYTVLIPDLHSSTFTLK